MKPKAILFFLILLLPWVGFGQVNILNAKSPDEIGAKTAEQKALENSGKPLPYGYVNERDILWSKPVWEYIDLNQKLNFPFLFPIDNQSTGPNRKSLFQTLIQGIKEGKIKNIYSDSYFKNKTNLSELNATLHYKDTLPQGYEALNAGEEMDEQFVDNTDIDGSDVRGYKIRGLWYFDKRQGELRYRIIALAPVVVDAYNKSQQNFDNPVTLFWVFYPDVRNLLYHTQVYNPDNAAAPHNFDELLNSRRFSSVIYKEGNELGDREIKDYIVDQSLKQLMESERIKEEIRAFEANMWSY